MMFQCTLRRTLFATCKHLQTNKNQIKTNITKQGKQTFSNNSNTIDTIQQQNEMKKTMNK
jgi:hypothetical protein